MRAALGRGRGMERGRTRVEGLEDLTCKGLPRGAGGWWCLVLGTVLEMAVGVYVVLLLMA